MPHFPEIRNWLYGGISLIGLICFPLVLMSFWYQFSWLSFFFNCVAACTTYVLGVNFVLNAFDAFYSKCIFGLGSVLELQGVSASCHMETINDTHQYINTAGYSVFDIICTLTCLVTRSPVFDCRPDNALDNPNFFSSCSSPATFDQDIFSIVASR